MQKIKIIFLCFLLSMLSLNKYYIGDNPNLQSTIPEIYNNDLIISKAHA